MAKKEVDEIMRVVREWLVEEGVYKDKRVDDSATYHFVVEFPPNTGRLADIIQPKEREDLLVIASGIGLPKEHYEALNSMQKPKRKEILWDIRFQLLFRESDFQMIPSAEDLQKIQFTRPLHFDGLTKNKFIECLREDYKCNLFILWKMKQLFGEAPPSSLEPMFG
ncbi:MAG TPA: DUF2299 family protein [Desulfobacteria bacterium]|nr:DUF2299 family protein [Desulfobacteria bacterium]